MNKILKKNSSFTLIELLVVIVIIGILAGLVTIAATSFINNSHNARMVAAVSYTHLDVYKRQILHFLQF